MGSFFDIGAGFLDAGENGGGFILPAQVRYM